jgi:hypothetical protein
MREKINEGLSPKLNELKTIFDQNELSKEWTKIADEVTQAEMNEQGLSAKVERRLYLDGASGDYTDWLKYRVQERLIK